MLPYFRLHVCISLPMLWKSPAIASLSTNYLHMDTGEKVLVWLESIQSVVVDLVVRNAMLPSCLKECPRCRCFERAPLPSLSWSVAIGHEEPIPPGFAWNMSIAWLWLCPGSWQWDHRRAWKIMASCLSLGQCDVQVLCWLLCIRIYS